MLNTLVTIGLTGKNTNAIFSRLLTDRLSDLGLPDLLKVDWKEKNIKPDWVTYWMGKIQKELYAQWQDFFFIILQPDSIVKAGFEIPLGSSSFVKWLNEIPFEVASLSMIHTKWASPEVNYIPYGFEAYHYSHGWACAFKGKGIEKLVSLRWLDYGPWLVLKEGNSYLVQFHDLKADALTALEQAQPGHKLLSLTEDGGYIEDNYVFQYNLHGSYDTERQVQKIIVHGREVSKTEMLDACAARIFNPFGANMPVKNIAFVFMKEEVAQRHLHDLWLRNLECWTIIKGEETRLDTNYNPPIQKPEWVQKLEQIN